MSNPFAGKRFVITGGAGFIGSHTTDFLIENGGEVLVADNLATGHLSNLEQHADNAALRFEEMDVAYPAALSKAVASFQPQAIIHLAALVSVQESIHNPELNFERNVTATHRVIEAAREHFPDAPAHQFAEARHGDIIHSLGNPDKAAEHLGFRATTTLDQGLKLYIEATGTDPRGL